MNKTRKTGAVLLAVLLAALTLSLCACGSKKTPVSADTFLNTAKEQGYEAVEIEMNEDTDPDVVASIDKGVAALKLDGSDVMITARFFEAKSDEKAQQLFNGTKQTADAEVGGSGVQSSSSVSLGNYSYYRVADSAVVYILARIDNTLLYIQAVKAYADDADALVKTLGYK